MISVYKDGVTAGDLKAFLKYIPDDAEVFIQRGLTLTSPVFSLVKMRGDDLYLAYTDLGP